VGSLLLPVNARECLLWSLLGYSYHFLDFYAQDFHDFAKLLLIILKCQKMLAQCTVSIA
jgi:hypothetical protein